MVLLARPKKNGLSYFPLDADFFEDNKIKILKARYGADGITMYIYLLCEIYKQGYYVKIDDDFEYIISSELGMGADKAKQVLTFLLSRSLFDNTLFQSDAVLTSAGIQKRFQLAIKERARKNPITVGRYWILKKEDTEPFIKCTLFDGFSDKNNSFSGKNEYNSEEKSLKKSKVKKSIDIDNNACGAYFQNLELDRAFCLYITGRINRGDALSTEQIQILKEELCRLSDKDSERIAIAKKAFASGWKSFYPIRKGKEPKSSKPEVKDNNNFEHRKYDIDMLEGALLKSRQ